MKISEQRLSGLYAAIAGPIEDLRVGHRHVASVARSVVAADTLDDDLFELQFKIFDEVKKALNITEGA